MTSAEARIQEPESRSGEAAPSAAEFRGVVVAVRRFLLVNADRVRSADNVTHKWLTDYIVFHAARGTLAICWMHGMVAGVAIAWQMHLKDLMTAVREKQDVFAWRPNDPTGDCVYLSLVIGEAPGVMQPLARYFLESCPNWRELKQFAHRRGKLVNARNLLTRLAK